MDQAPHQPPEVPGSGEKGLLFLYPLSICFARSVSRASVWRHQGLYPSCPEVAIVTPSPALVADMNNLKTVVMQ